MTSSGTPPHTTSPARALRRVARTLTVAVSSAATRADRATASAAASNAAAALVRPRSGPDEVEHVRGQLDALESLRDTSLVRGSA